MKAWKFTAEIEQDGGGVLPQTCYVKASDLKSAFATLKREYPSANVLGSRLEGSEDELHASGGAFLRDVDVRCVRL